MRHNAEYSQRSFHAVSERAMELSERLVGFLGKPEDHPEFQNLSRKIGNISEQVVLGKLASMTRLNSDSRFSSMYH